MKKKHAVSDAVLSKLWSKAVVALYKRCPVSGRTDGLQAHHAVPKGRQNRFAIRWEIRNGIPLDAGVHRAFHDGDLRVQKKVIEYMEDRGDADYCMRLKHMMKHEYLMSIGLTEDEYRLKVKKELEEIIRNG